MIVSISQRIGSMRTTSFFNTRPAFPAVLLLFFSTMLFVSCSKWTMPAELIGTWSGKNNVTFRTKDAAGNYVFHTAETSIRFVIHQDENMEGTVGAANFVECKISGNRSWIYKQLGWGTDFQITGGTLKGRINKDDPFNGKEIMVPFDLKDGKIRGTIFLNNDGAKFPMVDLELSKE